MRILHVVQGYTPAIGGTEQFIQKLSERLVSRHGDKVTVFTTTAAKNCELFWLSDQPALPVGTEEINGVTVRRFPIFNRFGYLRHKLSQGADFFRLPFQDWFHALFNGPLIFGMTQAIARFPADIVMASSFPFLHMHYALKGGQQSQKPVILIGALHTTDKWNFDRPMIYKAIRQAQKYISHSHFEETYLIKRGISAAKVKTIGVGIDLEKFIGGDGQKLRQEYGWEDHPVVLYVGHLARRKGVAELLSAIPKVWERYPEARFLLAGASSSQMVEIEQRVAQLSPVGSQRIIIKPDFSEVEKIDLFSACDLLVFPSVKESFGIVFLEAWACHKPVIGIRQAAIPTIVEEGVDGLLAHPDDTDDLARQICHLLAHPEQGRQMGQAGYQKVEQRYTWDIVTDKFRHVYQSLRKDSDER